MDDYDVIMSRMAAEGVVMDLGGPVGKRMFEFEFSADQSFEIEVLLGIARVLGVSQDPLDYLITDHGLEPWADDG